MKYLKEKKYQLLQNKCNIFGYIYNMCIHYFQQLYNDLIWPGIMLNFKKRLIIFPSLCS